jgi:16S rRNA (guanine966-N2)-methyltransferase
MNKSANKPNSSNRSKQQSNQLRIIGGQWRGRKLAFPTLEGLRPTPDRIRETLFNWLNTELAGSVCLDLFAGSGALGLEAVSRGAAHTDLVDSAAAACLQLNQHLHALKTDKANVHQATAEHWLQQCASNSRSGYNIIFLDPPFHQQLAARCIDLIDQHQLLAPTAWVYLEMNSGEASPALPTNWQPYREKTAGQVCYRLFQVESQCELSAAEQV